jgi:DNA-binding transcriptional LysR family regulator
MELRHLRYFVQVAEYLHFGRAAQHLGISQPPLSMQIRLLEEELGVRLFDRHSRNVALTGAGRVFLEEARATLRHAERAIEVARRHARGEVGELAVGFSASAPFVPAVAHAIYAFRQRFPDVRLQLSELSNTAQLAAIAERRIDVGFLRSVGSLQVPAHVTAQRLVSEPLFLAMRPDHPLAAREELALCDLHREAMVFYGRDQAAGFTEELIDLMSRSDITPSATQDVSEVSTLLGLVAAGVGVTVLSESLCGIQSARIVYRPIAHGKVETVLWFVHHDQTLSLPCEAFLAIVRAEKAEGTP